jgi:hypothetical protein
LFLDHQRTKGVEDSSKVVFLAISSEEDVHAFIDLRALSTLDIEKVLLRIKGDQEGDLAFKGDRLALELELVDVDDLALVVEDISHLTTPHSLEAKALNKVDLVISVLADLSGRTDADEKEDIMRTDPLPFGPDLMRH